MKLNNLYILLLMIFAAGFVGCGDDEYESIEGEYGNITLEPADALLNVNTPVVSFQAGTPSYNLNFDLVNGQKKINTINVYSVFTDAASGAKSDEILFKSYSVGDMLRTNFSDEITYDQLREGIVVNGNPLPADELAVSIGSGWQLRFEGDTDTGIVPFNSTVRVAVLSRFAGIYTVTESNYFRIGEDNGDWNGTEIFIGSVDETTFSHTDFWGPFGWAGNSFTFTIDEGTNEIVVPLLNSDGSLANGNALFSGNRGIGCHTEPGIFANVPCEGSNVLIPDDVNGKHIIRLTYGYFTDGSGLREFYEVLEKN